MTRYLKYRVLSPATYLHTDEVMKTTTTTDMLEMLIADLKRGKALRDAIQDVIRVSKGPLQTTLKEWHQEYSSGKEVGHIHQRFHYVENTSLFTLLEYGLQGYPILQNLETLKIEVAERVRTRTEQRLLALPYKMMIPLFIFFFPALMWSFLAPFLREMLNGF